MGQFFVCPVRKRQQVPSGFIQRSDYESSGGVFKVEAAAGGSNRPGSAVIGLQLFRKLYDHSGHSEGLQAMCQTSSPGEILFNPLSASYLCLFPLKSQQLELAVCAKAVGAFADHDDSNLCGYSDAGCQTSPGPAHDIGKYNFRERMNVMTKVSGVTPVWALHQRNVYKSVWV